MEHFTPDLLIRCKLKQSDAFMLALTSRTMYGLVLRAWCIGGITLSQHRAHKILEGSPYLTANLECLRLRNYCRYEVPWTAFAHPLPKLRSLVLERPSPCDTPWSDVLATLLPSLKQLVVRSTIRPVGMTRVMSFVREVVTASAPVVEVLRVYCHAASSGHGRLEGVCLSLSATWNAPIVVSKTLTQYYNIGQQSAGFGVDAPLTEAILEESDAGPHTLPRIGPTCHLTLRRLAVSFPLARPPENVRSRFPNVDSCYFEVRGIEPSAMQNVWNWLHDELPMGTTQLTLKLDTRQFLKEEGVVTCDPRFLREVPVEELKLYLTHLVVGSAEMVRSVAKACPHLRRLVVSTQYCAVSELLKFRACCNEDEEEAYGRMVYALRRERVVVQREAEELRLALPELMVTLQLITKD